MADKLLSQLLRGTYNGATAYTIGDIVDYEGSSYACKANTTGNLPTNTTYWALLAEKGEQGIQGIQGIQGVKGDIGITWQGAWSAGTYQINDGVSHTGSSWIATAITTEEPSGSATDWDLVAEKGVDGAGSGTVTSVSATVPAGLTISGSPVTTTGTLAIGLDTDRVIPTQTALSAKAPIASPTFTGTVSGITSTMVGLGNVDNTSDATKNSATATLTNKRINPRLVTTASYTTDTGTSLNIANCDQFEITAQAGALLFNAPGGTPLGGQKLIIRIKDNGTARALTYNAIFRAMGNALPTTTVLSKTLYMGFIYNATDTRWDLVAVAQEA